MYKEPGVSKKGYSLTETYPLVIVCTIVIPALCVVQADLCARRRGWMLQAEPCSGKNTIHYRSIQTDSLLHISP